MQTNTYTHSQGVPACTWEVDHGLDALPAVVVLDSAGRQVEHKIVYTNKRKLQVVLSEPVSGKAVCVDDRK